MTAPPLCDAHTHLHDHRLDPWRSGMAGEMRARGIERAVVNGTGEHDWNAVSALCAEHPEWLPAFGVHPWHVRERTPRWEEELRRMLDLHPAASIGEIGLDQWIDHTPLTDQLPVFARQWEIACERNLPVTVHCVRAHEPLRQFCQKHEAPACGFLIHAWSGPRELIPFFAERGACFSFSTHFLHPRKAAARAAFADVPADRLLLETDAPDLAPPMEQAILPLSDQAGAKPVNHPANLLLSLTSLAEVRGMTQADLARLTTENWRRLFVANEADRPE